MDNIFSNIRELLVILCEASLFTYFLCNRFRCKYSLKIFIPVSIVINFTTIYVSNILAIPINFRLLLFLFLQIGLASLFMEDSLANKLFWGGLPIIISVIADNLCFFIAIFFTPYQSNELIENTTARTTMSIIYVLLFALLVFFFSKIKKTKLIFPVWLHFIFFAVIFIGIFASDMLLTIIVTVESLAVESSVLRHLNTLNVLLLFVFTILLLLVEVTGRQLNKNHQLELDAQLRKTEQQQLDILFNTSQTLREWKHDYKNQLGVLYEMIKNDNLPEATEYISSIVQDMPNAFHSITTGNTILDGIFSIKLPRMESSNIKFTHSIFIPNQLPLSPLELSSVLGNLFDNAIEACEYLTDSNIRYIDLKIRPYHHMLSISMENSCTGNYRFTKQGTLATIKKGSEHGMGVKRITQIIESANGFLKIQPENDSFLITIAIPFEDEQEHQQTNTKSNNLQKELCYEN